MFSNLCLHGSRCKKAKTTRSKFKHMLKFRLLFFLVFSVGFDLLLLEVCDSRSEGGSKLPFIGCNLNLGFF